MQVYTLNIQDLLSLGLQRVTRLLMPDECKRYFESETCPPLPSSRPITLPHRNPRMRSVSASAFEFISENSQITSIREFIQPLPETLHP